MAINAVHIATHHAAVFSSDRVTKETSAAEQFSLLNFRRPSCALSSAWLARCFLSLRLFCFSSVQPDSLPCLGTPAAEVGNVLERRKLWMPSSYIGTTENLDGCSGLVLWCCRPGWWRVVLPLAETTRFPVWLPPYVLVPRRRAAGESDVAFGPKMPGGRVIRVSAGRDTECPLRWRWG